MHNIDLYTSPLLSSPCTRYKDLLYQARNTCIPDTSLLVMPPARVSVSELGYGTSSPIAPDQPQISFTRQLWQRNMPADSANGDSPSLSRSKRVSIGSSVISREYIRHPADDISAVHDLAHADESQEIPLTPEQSPPARPSRKRSADQVDDEDQFTSSHSRESSESFQPCLCRPEPKIPRPRNGELMIVAACR